MRKLRVLVMMDPALIPPASVAGLSPRQIAPFKTELDVLTALRSLGHQALPVGVKSDLKVLGDAIRTFRPHICFNLVEDFDGIPWRDQHVVSYLELLGQQYTGCNPRGLTLARDKALTKKILSYHGILTPRFAVFGRNRPVQRPPSLEFPLLVKSLTHEGSLGICGASVVHDDSQLRQRVAILHQQHDSDAIAEQYIPGRELYVSILGNRKLISFPIWELHLEGLPPGAPQIATSKVKWNERYRQRHRIQSGPAELPKLLTAQITELGKQVYRLLELSGYARIDLRLAPHGQVYWLEANPNPQIARDEDFADSAAADGIDYESLLQRIVSLGLSHSSLRLAA